MNNLFVNYMYTCISCITCINMYNKLDLLQHWYWYQIKIIIFIMPTKVSCFLSPHASPQTRTSAFVVFATKQCPIAAKIAGSIGIMPCCILNDFFHMGFERLRPLLATILCAWEIWSGSNNRVYMYHVHVFHWLANKITPPPPHPKKCVTTTVLKPTCMTRNRRLLFLALHILSKSKLNAWRW